MNILSMLLNDPVVFISFAGLLTVLGICGFYVWFFLRNIKENR